MIILGRVICNLCSCDMGALLIPSQVTFHVCPDCYEASEPAQ